MVVGVNLQQHGQHSIHVILHVIADLVGVVFQVAQQNIGYLDNMILVIMQLPELMVQDLEKLWLLSMVGIHAAHLLTIQDNQLIKWPITLQFIINFHKEKMLFLIFHTYLCQIALREMVWTVVQGHLAHIE